MNEPFHFKDCALVSSMGGVEPAMNARELLERVAICPIECLVHHFCETVLRPTFDHPEFRNDLALWSARDLRDSILAERLGAINPYRFDDFENLRRQVVETIEIRLSELVSIPWALRGHEFQFMRSVTVIFDTDLSISAPAELALTIPKLTHSSVFFHFVIANRRSHTELDDFSRWLKSFGKESEVTIGALRAIDFYHMTLAEVKSELIAVFESTS